MAAPGPDGSRMEFSQLPSPDGVYPDMTALSVLECDAQLMLRVQEGDQQSFALLLEKYRTPVLQFLYRMVQDRPVAEELAQEVFLRVYRSRASYTPSARFTTWLYCIATHLALNWLRDHRNEKTQQSLDGAPDLRSWLQIADRSSTIEQVLLHRAQAAEIRSAIQALPAKQRAAVLMHKYQEMDYRQIAAALGCSESAVKSLLFRAYETLRSRLAHMVSRGAVK